MKQKYKIAFAMLFVVLIALIVFNIFFHDEKLRVLKEYSPEGKLLGTNEYIIRNGDTILQGKFINYNEKGIKISEGQFIDNEPKGICSYYYDNGKIKSVYYKKNSKVDLEATYYNKEGLIRKYVMCNDFSEPKFIIEFDEKTVKMYDGYATYPVNQYKIERGKKYKINIQDTLKVGDVIKYDYLLANIPNTKRTFKIATEGIENSTVKRTITYKEPTRIVVEEVLTKRGLNRIKAITQYIFNDKATLVKNDTISFDINVN
ncbi:hypothetical protein [Flavobacterium sp. FlaQc-47]|uniref:hypothetical protein n=1 Tax=Flavobacterium sp. FlaQc-47 TaxID=3374180 RepID=UPI003756F10C